MGDENNSGQQNLQECKVFVGGLQVETSNESLKAYYIQFGDILDAVVMRDGATRKSRGFGFVTFADQHSVDECLNSKPHIVDGKEVETKRAVPKEDSAPATSGNRQTKKVFLGGLAPETTKEEIQEMLSPHGKVIDVQIMTEKYTNKPRGFGFAIFDSVEDVDKLCMKKYYRMKDRDVEVKKAISQEDMRRDAAAGASGGGGGRYSRSSGGGNEYGYGGRGGGDQYGRSNYYPKMADYRMQAGYDYRYPPEYMRGDYMAGGYGMGAYPDRMAQAPAASYQGYGGTAYRYPQGYDMSAYYAQSGGSPMGSYSQTASNYGPARNMYGTNDKDKDRTGTANARGFHPYRRTCKLALRGQELV